MLNIWHINRKELFGLAQSLQQIDVVIEQLSAYGSLRTIRIATDSKVVALQLNEFATYNSNSIERRVLLRLRHNVIGLWRMWRHCPLEISLRHIPGSENQADQLTRLFAPNDYDVLPQVSTEQISTELDVCVLAVDALPDFSLENLLALQQRDDAIQSAKEHNKFYFTDPNGLVRHKSGSIYLPLGATYEVLTTLHQQAGHL